MALDTSTSSPDRTEPVALHRPARAPVLATAAVVALAHLAAVVWRPGRWFDEALQLAIGRHHLDWGSVDQPPVTPLLARLADTIAPGSPLALSVPATLATAACVVLAALLARELGADRRAQTLTALAQATGLWAAIAGHWLTPYTLEPAFWLAIVWLTVRWVRTRDDRLLLVLGVVVGLGAETKFHIPVLAAVLLVSAAAVGPRELLTRPKLWVGALLALALAAPTFVWQHLHGWPQVRMAAGVADQAFIFGGRPGIAVLLIGYAGLLCLGLGAVGLVALLTDRRWHQHRFLAVAFLVLFAAFVIPPGRPNYLVGMHAVMAAAGAVSLQWRREAGRRRWSWAMWPAAVVSVAMSLLVLFGYSAQAASPAVSDRVVATTAQAWRSLPLEQQQRTSVWADSFIYAAYLDTAPPGAGLPPVYSSSVAYGYFPPPPESQDAALFVATSTGAGAEAFARTRALFAEARAITSFTPGPGEAHLYGGQSTTTVWLLTGKQVPWVQVRDSARIV